MALHSSLGLALITILAIRFLYLRYTYGLGRFKGPLLASFTDAWRLFYNYRAVGKPYIDLHDRWGDIVRVGPNALSFRDPQAIRDIFGAGKNWGKVRTLRLCLLSGLSAKYTNRYRIIQVGLLLCQCGSLQRQICTHLILLH